MTDWIDPMMDNANMGPGKSELQDRLRRFADHEQFPTFKVVAEELHKAADALDEKDAEIERLQKEIDDCMSCQKIQQMKPIIEAAREVAADMDDCVSPGVKAMVQKALDQYDKSNE